MKISQVYLNQTNKRIDMVYDYLVPETLQVEPGMRVLVNFGQGKRVVEGFVVRMVAQSAFQSKLKPILAVIDHSPVLRPEQIRVCLWMKTYYFSLFYQALSYFTTPVKVIKTHPKESKYPLYKPYKVEEIWFHLEDEKAKVRGAKQQKIIDILREEDCSKTVLKERLGAFNASLKRLISLKVVSQYDALQQAKSDKITKRVKNIEPSGDYSLKSQALFKQIQNTSVSPQYLFCKDKNDRLDVYEQLIKKTIQANKTAVLLFPEILLSLTIKERFFKQFGQKIAICHGKMTKEQRYLVYTGIKKDEIKVVIGSMTAIFMPFQHLDLILMEEEQDPSYYAVSTPRFHTRDIVLKLAKVYHSKVVLSATLPAIQALFQIEQKHYRAIGELEPLKKCIGIDMTDEMRAGNFDFLSRSVKNHLEKNLKAQELTLLMINRKGFSGARFCRACGYVEKCPICGLPFREHTNKSNQQMQCSFCGYTEKKDQCCPKCGSEKYRAASLGIDQVYQALKKRYPAARILKIDSESIKDYESYQAIDQTIQKQQWDIVIGTRLINRPFHFQKATLAVGLLLDNDLNAGTYDADEQVWQFYDRFFDKTTKDGLCIFQTYETDTIVAKALMAGNLSNYYQEEIQYRKMMKYPPVVKLCVLQIMHERYAFAERDATQLYKALAENAAGIILYQPVYAGCFNQKHGFRINIKIKRDGRFHETFHQIIAKGYLEKLAANVAIAINPPEN